MVTQKSEPTDADLLEKIEAILPKLEGKTPLQLAMVDICIRLRFLLRQEGKASTTRLTKPRRDRAAYMRGYRSRIKAKSHSL